MSTHTLNNINLQVLIEFFTFPLNRFLSGVVTGTEEDKKLEFLKKLIADAKEEYKTLESSPVFIILDSLTQFSKYTQSKDFHEIIIKEISSYFSPETSELDFRERVVKQNRPMLLVFNKFDLIDLEYKHDISNVIETLFNTTEDGSPIKISMLFLVKGDKDIFEYFNEDTVMKVSSMKLPPYNFDFISS